MADEIKSEYLATGPATQRRPTPRLANVQALRAIAAILVVASHVILIGGRYGVPASLLAPLTGIGEVGVYLFFVISGFIMSLTTMNSDRTPVQFMANRLLRIYPIYFILTVLYFASASVGALGVSIPDLSVKWLASSLLFVSQLALGKLPLLYVGWTLEYEMLFYLLFAGALFVHRAWLRHLLLVVAIIGVIGIVHVAAIAICFVYGVIVFKVTIERKFIEALLLMALSFGVLALAGVDLRGPLNWLWYPAAVAVAVAAPQIRSRVLLLLGNASYSIYLTHIFVLPAFFRMIGSVQKFFPPDISLVAVIALSTGAGVLFFKFIERPITEWLGALRQRRLAVRT